LALSACAAQSRYKAFASAGDALFAADIANHGSFI
jgi:hypothetical protein